MKLLFEDDRPYVTIVLTPGKCQASGTIRHVRLRRHNKPKRCAVGALALQRAYLLDINYYSGPLVIPGRRFDERMTTEASSKVMRQLKDMSGIVDKSNNMHGLRHTVVNLMLNIGCPSDLINEIGWWGEKDSRTLHYTPFTNPDLMYFLANRVHASLCKVSLKLSWLVALSLARLGSVRIMRWVAPGSPQPRRNGVSLRVIEQVVADARHLDRASEFFYIFHMHFESRS